MIRDIERDGSGRPSFSKPGRLEKKGANVTRSAIKDNNSIQ